jgi:hypothetical protein
VGGNELKSLWFDGADALISPNKQGVPPLPEGGTPAADQ